MMGGTGTGSTIPSREVGRAREEWPRVGRVGFFCSLVWPAAVGRFTIVCSVKTSPRIVGSPAPRLPRPAGVALVVAAALFAGCGAGHDGTEKQMAELRAELTKLRSDSAAMSERLDNLEISKGRLRSAGAGSPESPADRPDLEVVRLTPDAAGGPSETDAEGARTVIRSAGGGAVVEDSGAGPAKAGGAAQRDYDQAMELFKAKSYDKALEAFAGFLVRYPDHGNVDNATYWRGECYFAKSDFRRAAEQFEAVAAGYPKGNKAPDALFKLAQSYTRLNDPRAAEQTKKKLLSNYPTSEAAQKLSRASAPSPKP